MRKSVIENISFINGSIDSALDVEIELNIVDSAEFFLQKCILSVQLFGV